MVRGGYEAQKAVIAMLRPGNTYEQAVDAGKAIFEKNGVGKQWTNYPGHFVGLATHDVLMPKGPIRPARCQLSKPILEFPEQRIEHFRVEDTVLVADSGPEILSSGVPKEMTDVEKLVAQPQVGVICLSLLPPRTRRLFYATCAISRLWVS